MRTECPASWPCAPLVESMTSHGISAANGRQRKSRAGARPHFLQVGWVAVDTLSDVIK